MICALNAFPQYVEEDKHFLLERLLNFEKPPLSPQQTPDLSDSDAEVSL